MKQKLHANRWLRTLTGGAALFLLSGFFMPVQATLLLNDNFDYDTGNLLGQGEWNRQGTTATSPIQVVDTALTYAGYQDTPEGKAVRIGNSGEDLYKEFTAVSSGTVYLSALVNLNQVQSSANQGEYFLHFGEGGGSSIFSGRLMAKRSENDKIMLGITRSGTSTLTVWDPQEYELNTTLLVVIKYNIVEGGKNDVVNLFVNPVINGTEPEPTATTKTETGVEISQAGSVGIRQGASSRTALGVIDALRVATEWNELFPGSTPPQPTPKIIVTPSSVYFGNVFAGETYTKTVTVKAQNLTEDIRVSTKDGSELSVPVATIDKTTAETEEGFSLILTLNPTNAENYTDEVRLVTAGLDTVRITPMWSTTVAIPVANIGELRQVDLNDPEISSTVFKLTGECTVSHVYKEGEVKYIYIQDQSSALTIWDNFGDIATEYKTGDKLTHLYLSLENVFGTRMALPAADPGEALSHNNEIIPLEVTLAELAANPVNYEARLVTVKEVSFTNRENENEGIFTQGTNNKISQNGTEATMRVFKGADFIGQPIPVKANLTGIPTASTGKLIAPRSAADIEEIGRTAPSITCTPSSVTFGFVFTGETYTATLNIKATDLQENIRIALKDGSELSVSETEIEKSATESENGADLTLTLNPANPDNYIDEIQLVTAGTDTVKIRAVWSATVAIPVANIAELRQVDMTNPEIARATYKLTGECFVSHLYKDGDAKYIYIQDHSSAATLWDMNQDIATEYVTGDKLSNLYVTLEKISGTLMLLPAADPGAPLSQHNEIIPQEVTLAELAANPENYEARLITVKEVSFFNRENENQGIFTEGTQNKISQGETEATMRVFKGADFLGQTIPAKATLTGISTASTGKLIAPRSAADIVEITEQPTTPKSLITDFNEGLPEGWVKEAGWEYRNDEGVDGTGCMYIEGPADYTLTSPTVDLSAGKYSLTYQYKWIPMGDWMEEAEVRVMISNDNGLSYADLGKWKRANSFTEATFDLAAYTSPTTKIRFAFVILNQDDWTDGGNGWLDNFKLTSESVSIESQKTENLAIIRLNGKICITAPEAIASVRLIDLNGRVIKSAGNPDGYTYEMPVENLSAGVYLLEIISNGNKTIRKIAVP